MKLKSDLGAALAQTAMAVDDKIQQLLPLPKDTNGSKHALVSAMRYTCLSGGKKIRPFLVLSTAELFSVS
jgi:farnesyl diphosphate synthase